MHSTALPDSAFLISFNIAVGYQAMMDHCVFLWCGSSNKASEPPLFSFDPQDIVVRFHAFIGVLWHLGMLM